MELFWRNKACAVVLPVSHFVKVLQKFQKFAFSIYISGLIVLVIAITMPKRKRDNKDPGEPSKRSRSSQRTAGKGAKPQSTPGSSKGGSSQLGKQQQTPSGTVTYPSSLTKWKNNLPSNHGKISPAAGLIAFSAGSVYQTTGIVATGDVVNC